ncbi:MAG: hypothetical protein ACI8X5_003243 [Planctomycetota bacterium]
MFIDPEPLWKIYDGGNERSPRVIAWHDLATTRDVCAMILGDENLNWEQRLEFLRHQATSLSCNLANLGGGERSGQAFARVEPSA